MSALAYLPQDATVFSVGPYYNREDRSYNKKMTYARVYATFCTFFRFFSCIRLCMAIWLIMYVYSPALYAGFPSFISPEFYSGFIICRCFLCSLPPDCIRHSSFILSDAIRATFNFHTFTHPCGFFLCLSLPI